MRVETQRDVLAAVDDASLVQLAQRLIEIPTENPPGNERLAAELLADYFSDNGWATSLSEVAPGRPNVVARIGGRGGGDGPRLIFDGHLDVVPAGDGWTSPPFAPVVKDGRLIGRGAADMKGGLAAMIAAAEAVQRAQVPLEGELVLAAVADEEEGGGGTRELVRSGLRGTWAIVPEPTELQPVVAHKGSANIHVAVHGSAAHASTPEQGVNAIEHASALLERLHELAGELRTRRHVLLGHPTLTVCTISGGFNDYTVPDTCQLTLNRRLVPPETESGILSEIAQWLELQKRSTPSFRAESVVTAFTPPMETDVNSPVVLALRSAAGRVLGSDPGVSGWSATCDASILSHEANIATVVFGPGSIGKDAHRPDESVSVLDLVHCARIFALTITELLGEHD